LEQDQEQEQMLFDWEHREREQHARDFNEQFDNDHIARVYKAFEADMLSGASRADLMRKHALRKDLYERLTRIVKTRNPQKILA
jgi:hypothetical protein